MTKVVVDVVEQARHQVMDKEEGGEGGEGEVERRKMQREPRRDG
jgi:hypothetical protein